jgi:hypothetical protein
LKEQKMARKKSGDSGAQSEVARPSETVLERAKSNNTIQGSSLTLHETPEARHARIAEAAYRKAGNRGFAPGGELDDWLAAEREVSAEDPAAPSAAS